MHILRTPECMSLCQNRVRSEVGTGLLRRIPDTGRTHDGVGREGKDRNGLREVGMRRGTGILVDPQTGELTRGYTGLNNGTGI